MSASPFAPCGEQERVRRAYDRHLHSGRCYNREVSEAVKRAERWMFWSDRPSCRAARLREGRDEYGEIGSRTVKAA